MFNQETLEQIEEILGELKKYAAEGVPIVVEGARDKQALLALGVVGSIFQISSNKKTLLNFIEGLSNNAQIIILTDFDRAGEELAKFCHKHFRQLGVKPIVEPREKLKMLLRKNIKDIQGLAKFILNLRFQYVKTKNNH